MINKNVLITGARAASALDMARMVSKDNTVFMADSIYFSLSRFSNCVKKFFYIPKPVFDLKKYEEDLIKIIKKNKIDILIPTCEEAFFISKIKNNLEKHCYIFVDNEEKMKTIHSKINMFKLIKGNEYIKAPKTKRIEYKDLKKVDINKNLIKIEYSRFGEGVFMDNKNIKNNKNRNFLVQEKIKGKEYSTYTIAKEGKVINTVVYYSSYKIECSCGVLFKALYHKKIEKFIEKFIENNNYTGQIGFDIIENEEGLYLIDANPRTTSGMHFFKGNLDLLNNKSNIINIKESKSLLIPLLFMSNKKDKTIKEIIKDIFISKSVIFNIKDPLPSIFQYLMFFEFLYKKIKYKKKIIEISTFDIEYNC